jgi:hypothetical protein
MENGERMAAVAAVRSAENRLLGVRGHDAGAAPAPLQRAIGDAGRRCMPKARQAVAELHVRRGARSRKRCRPRARRRHGRHLGCARGDAGRRCVRRTRGRRNSCPTPTWPLSPCGQLFGRRQCAVSLPADVHWAARPRAGGRRGDQPQRVGGVLRGALALGARIPRRRGRAGGAAARRGGRRRRGRRAPRHRRPRPGRRGRAGAARRARARRPGKLPLVP